MLLFIWPIFTAVYEKNAALLSQVYLEETAENTEAVEVYKDTFRDKAKYINAIKPNSEFYTVKTKLNQIFEWESPENIFINQLDDVFSCCLITIKATKQF